jgi:hypothetical protein
MTTSEHGSTHYLKHRKYGAIYADPPWSFRNWSAKGTGRNAVSQYDCMDFDRLAGFTHTASVRRRLRAVHMGDRSAFTSGYRFDACLGLRIQNRGVLLGEA